MYNTYLIHGRKMTYRLHHYILLLTFAINIEHVLSRVLLSSSNCTTKDKGHHTYNFAQLSSSDITISDDGGAKGTITLRLCSPLLKKCGGHDGYGICWKKNGKEIGIGRSPLKLENTNHTLLFASTGDLCERDKNYTVVIIMKCDYSVAGDSGPEITSDREDPCEIRMTWNTKFACLPPLTSDCSISDRFNNTFDLSPLRKSSDNHIVYLDKTGNSPARMVINVCHSIIHEDGAACRGPAGACLVKSSGADNEYYTNYGVPDERSLVIEDNILKIRYKNGDLCRDPLEDDLPHYQTTISFICDPAATLDTKPEYSNESKPCDCMFTWRTTAACNKKFLDQWRIENAAKCTVVDPETKYRFNLETLTSRNIVANTAVNTTQYNFRICGPVSDAGCSEITGICDIKNNASAGAANSNLMWRPGGPYLNYTDGAPCGNGNRRYTLIAFVCKVDGSESLPIILKDEPCYLIIHWYTDLACDKNIQRITCARNETNLAPLIRTSGNYVVKVADTEFHINICRPVVPVPGLACPHGSAVCQAVPNTNGQYTGETSLGLPDRDLILDGDENLILNYSQGSPCTENPETNISSSFKFFCDYRRDAGLPEYKNYSNCHYTFEWKTNIVCGAVAGEWFSPCTIRDPYHSRELDLSSLYKRSIPQFVTGEGKNYSVNICGGKQRCNGSAICQEKNGYGTFSHVTFDYRSELIKLHYSNGTKCSDKSYASELSLICNNTAGIGEPVLKLDANCIALFEWQTDVACLVRTRELISSDLPIAHYTERTSIDNSQSDSIQTWVVSGMLMLVVIVIAVWLYLRNPRGCAHLGSRISAITARQNHSRVQYSREDAW